MTAEFIWATAGLVLCGAELLHPGVYLLWIGLAAVATGGMTWLFGPTPSAQIVMFLVALAALLTIPWLHRRRRPHYDGGVNASESGLVGETCRAIAFEGTEGRVAFRDSTWAARLVSGVAPVPGTSLRITGLKGTTLLVATMPTQTTASP